MRFSSSCIAWRNGGFALRFGNAFQWGCVVGEIGRISYPLDTMFLPFTPQLRSLQLGEVGTRCMIVRIRQTSFIPVTLPLMEIHMHLPHIVKQISNADGIRLIANFIFIGFHGLSSIKSLTPFQWVGRDRTLRFC